MTACRQGTQLPTRLSSDSQPYYGVMATYMNTIHVSFRMHATLDQSEWWLPWPVPSARGSSLLACPATHCTSDALQPQKKGDFPDVLKDCTASSCLQNCLLADYLLCSRSSLQSSRDASAHYDAAHMQAEHQQAAPQGAIPPVHPVNRAPVAPRVATAPLPRSAASWGQAGQPWDSGAPPAGYIPATLPPGDGRSRVQFTG